MIGIRSLSIVSLALLGSVTASASMCKDCAFPLRVESGKWVMPNGRTQVEINEDAQGAYAYRVTVVLRDSKTHAFLAQGSTIRANFKNNFTLQLEDVGHRDVLGQIRWVDKRKDVIQARFTCASQCVIQPYLD